MPFPRPTDPDYCPGSNTDVEDLDDERQWFRCPSCGRLLKPTPRGAFYPHVRNRARTRAVDQVREVLDAHGHNRAGRSGSEGQWEFVELGEGLNGDHDPLVPANAGLLRLDFVVGGEEVESACTSLPVSATAAERDAALRLVRTFAESRPDLPPRRVAELFSHLEREWLRSGVPDWAQEIWPAGPSGKEGARGA